MKQEKFTKAAICLSSAILLIAALCFYGLPAIGDPQAGHEVKVLFENTEMTEGEYPL